MAIGSAPFQTVVTGTSGGGATATLTQGSTPTSGNTNIVCSGGTSVANPVTGIVQTGIPTWTKISFSNTTTDVSTWIGLIGAGASTSCAVNGSAGTSFRPSLAEWAGLTMTGATGTGASFTFTIAPTTPSITPTAGQPCLLIAACCTNINALTAPTNGFTAMPVANSAVAYAYLVVASASGSYSCGWTISGGGAGDACIAVIYGSAAPAGGLFLPTPMNGLGAGGPFFANPLSYHRTPQISLAAYRRERAAAHRRFMDRCRRAA